MADPIDGPVPPKPRRRRATKFVLPDHHRDAVVDDRTAELIEAFLDGPAAPTSTDRQTTGRSRGRRRRDTRQRRPFELDSPEDWVFALRHEGARAARYGRTTSVLVVEPGSSQPSGVSELVARQVTAAIRAEARETDRVVRVGSAGFRLLLPETEARAAQVLADRLSRAVSDTSDPAVPPVDLRIDVLMVPPYGSIEDYLAAAERRIANERRPGSFADGDAAPRSDVELQGTGAVGR